MTGVRDVVLTCPPRGNSELYKNRAEAFPALFDLYRLSGVGAVPISVGSDEEVTRWIADLARQWGFRISLWHLPGISEVLWRTAWYQRKVGGKWEPCPDESVYHTSRADLDVPPFRSYCPNARGQVYENMLNQFEGFLHLLNPDVVQLDKEWGQAPRLTVEQFQHMHPILKMLKKCDRCGSLAAASHGFRRFWIDFVARSPRPLWLYGDERYWPPGLASGTSPVLYYTLNQTAVDLLRGKIGSGDVVVAGGMPWVTPYLYPAHPGKGYLDLKLWVYFMVMLRAGGARGVQIYPGPYGWGASLGYESTFEQYAKRAAEVFGTN